MITPKLDNFASLAGWASSGLTATGGEVKAAVAGTVGRAYAAAGIAGDDVYMQYDVYVDKTDTAGRVALVGCVDSGSDQGWGSGYAAGTGIFWSLKWYDPNATPVHGWQGGGPIAIVVDGLLTTGRYRVAASVVSFGSSAYYNVRVYNEAGDCIGAKNFIGGSAWPTSRRYYIECNSNKCSISRFAADNNPAGSATTRANWTVPMLTERQTLGSAWRRVGHYVPARPRSGPPVVAIYCHGAHGFYEPSALSKTLFVESLLSQGVYVLYPRLDYGGVHTGSSGDGTDDARHSWGNDSAYGEAKQLIADARALYGADALIVLIGASMGGLTVGRLVTQGEVSGIAVALFIDAVTSMAYVPTIPGFRATFEVSHGIADSTNASQVAAATAAKDPLLLTQATPTLWREVKAVFTYTTGDTTVNPASNSQLMEAALGGAGIPFTFSARAFGNHAQATPRGDAELFGAAVADALANAVRAGITAAVRAGLTAHGLTEARAATIPTTGTIAKAGDAMTLADGAITAAKVAAAALAGKGDWSTYAGGDTAGTMLLLARVPAIITTAAQHTQDFASLLTAVGTIPGLTWAYTGTARTIGSISGVALPAVVASEPTAQDAATQAAAAVAAVKALPGAGVGDGDTDVDHDTGGADRYRFADSGGNGIDNADVIAYVASEYAAGTRVIRGRTKTDSNGRWVAPLRLNAGVTYTLRIEKPGVTLPAFDEVTP